MTTNTMVDYTKFYDMTDDELDDLAVNSLAPRTGTSTYRFVIDDASIGEWDSGPYLKIITKVVEGVEKDRTGPQITLSFSPFVGDEPDDDEIAVRTERRAAQIFTMLRSLYDGDLPVMPDSGEPEDIFDSVEGTIEGRQFIGVVRRGKNGFDEFGRGGVHSVSNPPKSYNAPVEEFHL